MPLLCTLKARLKTLCLFLFLAFAVFGSGFSSADESPAPKNENVLYSNIPSGRPSFEEDSLLAWNPSGSEYVLASESQITKYSRNGLPIASVTHHSGYVTSLASQDGILAYRANSSNGEDVVGLNWNDFSESWAIRGTYDIDGDDIEGALVIETADRLRVSTLADPDSSFLLSQSLQQLRKRKGAMLLVNDEYTYAVVGVVENNRLSSLLKNSL